MCTHREETAMGKLGGTLSRFGLVCGVSALTSLLVAFLSGSWLYTDEPILLPNSTRLAFSIGITIGLWTVCPYMKKINTTLHFTSPTCSLIKYKKWESIDRSNLEISDTLELAQIIVSRLRSCTVSCGSAVILIIVAVLLALLGHINSDKKILIACGIFILGGLSLGTGLVIFITYLTETLFEVTHPNKEPHFSYHYGWCFYLASTAFLLTNIAALSSILGYLETFPSVDEMVKYMVPGGERKLQQQVFKRNLPRQGDNSTDQRYDLLSNNRLRLNQSIYGPITSDTPPDVCTTSHPNFVGPPHQELDYDGSWLCLAGQTVPITIKNYNKAPPLPLSGIPIHIDKHEVFHDSEMAGTHSITDIHQDERNVIRHQRLGNKVTSEMLQVFEPGLLSPSDKRSKKCFFGSAV